MNFLNYFIDRFPIEWKILEAFDKIANDFLNIVVFLLSKFGSGEIVFAIILFLYYIVDKKLGKKLAYILGSSFIVNGILKSLCLAKRPFQFDGHEDLKKLNDSMDNSTGTSFPSGHSQNAGTIYSALYMNTKKNWIKGLCLSALIIVPLTRLYLGVHFPGDVLVGVVIGIIITLILNKIYDSINHTKKYYIIATGFILLSLPTMIINFNNPAVADLYKSFGLYIAIIFGFFHTVACIKNPFLLLLNTISFMDIIYLVFPFTYGWTLGWQFGAVTNTAVMNICIKSFYRQIL